jgi:hypothetical protein
MVMAVVGLTAILLTAGAVQAEIDTVLLQPGGSLSGQTVDASHYWIDVDLGATISGTIKVQTNNSHPPAAIAPFGYTATWGDRVAQVVTINSWIATGTNNYDISVNKTAPTTPGIYYLPIAFAGTYNLAQVMSATHPAWSAVWYDGNDVGWDWTAAQYQQSRDHGYVSQFMGTPDARVSGTMWDLGANWVGVNVTSEPAPVPEPVSLASGAIGLACVGACLRRRRQKEARPA